MSAYQLFEWLVIALIVGWSGRTAWRTLVPAIRASLQRRESGKACGSSCGGCDSSKGKPSVPARS